MDYEKKYKEAMTKMSAFLIKHDGFTISKDGEMYKELSDVFPELAESEDERIRKELIEQVVYIAPNDDETDNEGNVLPIYQQRIDKYITWLEKQGTSYTKRDVDNAYLKGVTDTKNEIEKQYEANYQIIKDIATFIFNYRGDIKDRAKWMDYLGIKVSFGEKQGEQKTKPKFKIGDVMRTLEEAKEGITDGLPVVVSIDEEYYYCNNELISIKDQEKYEYLPMNRKQKPAEHPTIPSKDIVLNVWALGNEWKELTKGICNTEYGTQLDYILKHWNEGDYYKKIEQKPADKVEPKFHEGEWVFIEEIKGYKQGAFQIKSVDEFGYNFDEYHTITFMYEELLSKWTIQDAKDGDVLTCYSDRKGQSIEQTGIIKQYVGRYCGCSNVFKAHFGVDWDNNVVIEEYMCGSNIYPATKEQRDTLERAITNAGYRWDKEKLKLEKV